MSINCKICKTNKIHLGQGRRRAALFFAVLLLILGCVTVSGCGTKVVLTTGFGKEDVFVIGDTKCTLPEMNVYLTDIQGQYENVYGDGIWDAQLDGVTLEDNVKDTVLARIAQVKTMYLLAVSKGVVLSEEEKSAVEEAANVYYSGLDDEQKEYLGVTRELLVQMYTEYALADMVYDAVIADINPEISDDEARTVLVQHIYFATGVTDAAGNFVMFTQDQKAELYNLAMEVKKRAENGEDFEALAVEYSSSSSLELSLGRDTMDPAIEKEVFSLAKGEISSIVETETGLLIFKCVSTLDREQTEANKIVLVEKRRQEAFKSEYDSFVNGLVKNLNNELWDSISLNRDFDINSSFFEIYDARFEIN